MTDSNEIFRENGEIRRSLFASDALEVFEEIETFLEQIGRDMFLPIDLLTILVSRGHDTLAESVAAGTEGSVAVEDVLQRLQSLSGEIEEEHVEVARRKLIRSSSSRGFTRILVESLQMARTLNRKKVKESDLAMAMLWRAEAVESASVRWAIRRLSEGAGDVLFDQRGMLRSDVFDESSWQLLLGSVAIAASSGTPFLGTPHLVAMMCSVRGCVIWRSAKERGLEPSRLREELLRLIGTKPASIPDFHVSRKTLTPRMVRMLSFAHQLAGENVAEQHLVEAFLVDGGSSLELVQALGLESEIRRSLGEPKVLAEALPVAAAIELGARRHATPTLDMLGRDLTAEAMEGKLPDIVGRETELERVLNVLLRKEQRNPLLTGEAGVGKTALALALAQRIADGQVPKRLLGHRVVEINGASLMSGTSYRGDLESRIRGLLEEASKNVILFIDEAHAVFAPRAGSHAPAEVPNHFKSALASGDIAVVGATTEAEYRRWFEQDPALKRRFERIEIGEPNADLVNRIMTTLAADLAKEYEVEVDPEAIEAAVAMSTRYLPEQRLPDKAKKLLMDACISCGNDLVESDRIVRREHVADQIVMKTGIPRERVLREELSWWLGFEDRLNEQVIGQTEAVRKIARTLVTGRLKRSSVARPLSVLAFAGPPGVGKAKLAHILAEEMFGDARALIRLDMTDFQESHSISRLIGSPPGYVGYEDEDVLVTPLRRRPSSIVLMEDFDRAHPQIQERILRLVNDGEISDTRGFRADASNAVFVLSIQTPAQTGAKIGFAESSPDAKGVGLLANYDSRLAERLTPYVDAIIGFQALNADGMQSMVELLNRHVARFSEAMYEEYQIAVEIDESMRSQLEATAATQRDANGLVAVVDQYLVSPITDALLGAGCAKKVTLFWDGERTEISSNEG